MNHGIWMQLVANTQVLAKDLLEHDCGVGVILSPRDQPRNRCADYSAVYRSLDASILFDHQFYLSEFQNEKLQSFETIDFRQSISNLFEITDAELVAFQARLETIELDMRTNAVLAPAVIYEPGDTKRIDLNHQLYGAAKSVGDALGIPTYLSVVLSRSFGSTEQIEDILSAITSVNADGFYFAVESNDDRICTSIYLQLYAGLLLRSQGLPLIHAYAGPAGLLSPAFGANSIALAPPVNSWGFSRKRFEGPSPGGLAKPLYFSERLWGSLVYPEELVALSEETIGYVLTPSPWATFTSPPWPKLEKGESERHLVFSLAQRIESLRRLSPIQAIQQTLAFMHNASVWADNIEHEAKPLRYDPRTYLSAWTSSLNKLSKDCDGFLQDL